jgi:hypothetical protein
LVDRATGGAEEGGLPEEGFRGLDGNSGTAESFGVFDEPVGTWEIPKPRGLRRGCRRRGRKKEDEGRRKEEGRSRKEEGGRRTEEGGRKK